MKRLLAISIFALLAGCQTPPLTGSNGQPIPPKVDYQCKQQCGMYDSKVSIVGAAMCMNECIRANGY
jgi:uncharacterized lipoprotein YajG